MTYNEGFAVVLMSFSGIYAAGVLHWSAEALIVQGLLNSVAAALAGALAGWMDLKIGSRRSAMIFVAGSCSPSSSCVRPAPIRRSSFKLAAAAAQLRGHVPHRSEDIVFCIAQVLAATFVTGGLSSSRALMGKLAPPAMLNEFFGVYAMSGTATSFVGPLAIGLVTSISHSQRIGIASGIAFLVVGMAAVAAGERTGRRAARDLSSWPTGAGQRTRATGRQTFRAHERSAMPTGVARCHPPARASVRYSGGRKGVRFAQLPQGNVLRGPLAHSRRIDFRRCDRFLKVTAGAEQVRIGDGRRRAD